MYLNCFVRNVILVTICTVFALSCFPVSFKLVMFVSYCVTIWKKRKKKSVKCIVACCIFMKCLNGCMSENI